MSPRRCSFVGENGLRCRNGSYLADGELCFVHAERARKDKQRLPSYGGGVLSKAEIRRASRTSTETSASSAGLSVEPVTRTEVAGGLDVEWDHEDYIDPLDRVEQLAAEYKRTRWGG